MNTLRRLTGSACPADGGNIKVYFMDGSYKSYIFHKRDTVEDLWLQVVEKLGLSREGAECFYLWASCDTLEILLYAGEKLQKVFKRWPKTFLKYHEAEGNASLPNSMNRAWKTAKEINPLAKTDVPEMKLKFRTTAILPLSVERNIKDPMAVYLFYTQAVYNVIHSNYPCEPDLAVELAGLQLQRTVGDHNPEMHVEGYLMNDKNLNLYVPHHLVSKLNTQECEAMILEKHKQCSGKDPFIVELLYLQRVRQWKYYGSTFFIADYTPDTTSFFEHPFQGEVRVGVNMEGLHVIDPRQMKTKTYGFREIKVWTSGDKFLTFVTPHEDIQRHVYKTAQVRTSCSASPVVPFLFFSCTNT
ncbi:hypothetical protein QOT17_006017 [Balamuthia mandrillaris]